MKIDGPHMDLETNMNSYHTEAQLDGMVQSGCKILNIKPRMIQLRLRQYKFSMVLFSSLIIIDMSILENI